MNEYCRNKAAPDGSNFYYASLYQSATTRARLHALFALYYELLDGVLAASDPGVTRMKLAWWREELARLQAGRPRHPVGEALQAVIEEDAIDMAPLITLPEAMESLFSLLPAEHGGGWYHVRGIGDFWRCTAAAAGPLPDEYNDFIETTGIGVARLEVLQNLRHLLSLGFNPLPTESLQEAGLDGQALMSDPASEATRRLGFALVTQVREELEAGYKQLTGRPGKHLLYALIMNRLAVVTCHEIQRDNAQLLSQRVALTPIRKLWIALRTKYARLIP